MTTAALKIVAIGGGNLRLGETARIDRRIVELAGTPSPHVLYLPTASGDDSETIEAFTRVYTEQGCRVTPLKLFVHRPPQERVEPLFARADIIYVGGGNTLRMMKMWRRHGIDTLLCRAAQRGAVCAGSSAGGICWFTFGHSDSRRYTTREGASWGFVRVRGLGLLPGTFCPHYHKESRERSFQELIARKGGAGFACDNNTAIEFVNNRWRVFRSRRSGKAYRVVKGAEGIEVQRLPADHEWRPLDALLPTAR